MLLHKVRLQSRMYQQIEGHAKMCQYCGETFTNSAKHWFVSCPVRDYQRRNMQDYLTEEQFNLQDTELIAVMLYSQNNRK